MKTPLNQIDKRRKKPLSPTPAPKSGRTAFTCCIVVLLHDIPETNCNAALTLPRDARYRHVRNTAQAQPYVLSSLHIAYI